MTTTDTLDDFNASLLRRDRTLAQVRADVAAYMMVRTANRGRRLASYPVTAAPGRSPSFYDRFRRGDGSFDLSAIKDAEGVEVE